jgi:hypothetical protein
MPDSNIYVVKEDPSYIRDGSSGAIINRNTSDYVRRLVAKQHAEDKRAEFETLKTEIQDLKNLVQSLINSASK